MPEGYRSITITLKNKQNTVVDFPAFYYCYGTVAIYYTDKQKKEKVAKYVLILN